MIDFNGILRQIGAEVLPKVIARRVLPTSNLLIGIASPLNGSSQ